MQDFRNLRVWEKSHHLTLAVYKATGGFPRAEMYGLTSQMRRAGSSIAANIAEACGRGGDGDFRRFLYYSMGSASELEYHLQLAHDLGFLSDGDHQRLAEATIEVKRMLASLIRRVKTNS